jgi:hypothetical protein
MVTFLPLVAVSVATLVSLTFSPTFFPNGEHAIVEAFNRIGIFAFPTESFGHAVELLTGSFGLLPLEVDTVRHASVKAVGISVDIDHNPKLTGVD